ncbi:MAG: GH92 family glycosyl hydrolase [Bacteroidales bacterium]|nr:GH92 family glycosyl hydrolase [Bacteroidales bacterium]
MKHSLAFLPLLLILVACIHHKGDEPATGVTSCDPVDYVDPIIGTDAHGHTFPGASLPFGMVQVSPDTRLEGWDGCSGYHYSDSVVFGFSHTHLSGTGVPDYCDILFMPTFGPLKMDNGARNPDEGYASRFSHSREEARAGYYSVFLDDYGITVELTATQRAGFHKYTFPAGAESYIIIDLKHRDKVVESAIRFVSDSEVEGFRRSTGWADNQVVYFVAKFSKPAMDYGIFRDEQRVQEQSSTGEDIKACLRFRTEEGEAIYAKTGISATGIEGARRNLEAGIPGWDFGKVSDDARAAWNGELKKVMVSGGTEEQKTVFYTALYHAYLAPNLFMDVDGSYLGRDFRIHEAEGFDYFTVFSLWDTFRAAHPLFTITQEGRTVDFIRTMLAQYVEGGRLPVWELAANETECMIGYHAVPVIADAWMKGIRGYDGELALAAMKNSAEQDHFGLKSYREHGFIPAEDEAESVSRTLEYAYDDWCIAIMARSLEMSEDYSTYIRRAQSWKNLFDPSTGFMRARMNGRWFEPFDPKEVNFNYTEANAWQYSFFVPHDISGLIDMLGGQAEFVSRLDLMFGESAETTGRQQSDITGLIGQYAHGNEPSHHMAYLYNYAGQPWKTQQRVRQVMDELYSDRPDGLCGNEDCGQMSAWYVLSAMGFYPVTPGDPVYAIGSPLFDEVNIHLENGATFTVRTLRENSGNIYIQSARLNGREYEKCFISHKDILQGGELILEMGERPNMKWASGEGAWPVSAITDQLIMPVPWIAEGARTFIDSTSVSLGSIIIGSTIHYTLDGSEPSPQSPEYHGPFTLTGSATLKSVAYKEGWPQSDVLKVEFSKIPAGRKITLNTEYAGQYAAGGDMALIDFIRGPKNFRTGAWQGYQGADLDVLVDLGSLHLITRLETGFLQDAGSWIFMPPEVSYFISENGRDFRLAGTVNNDIDPKQQGTVIRNFSLNVAAKTRFIRVIAKNRGVCPEWHAGDGQPAWIFADEIVIE